VSSSLTREEEEKISQHGTTTVKFGVDDLASTPLCWSWIDTSKHLRLGVPSVHHLCIVSTLDIAEVGHLHAHAGDHASCRAEASKLAQGGSKRETKQAAHIDIVYIYTVCIYTSLGSSQ
jgi:hypothetical protein